MSSLVPPSRPVRIRSQDVAANPQPRAAPAAEEVNAWEFEDPAFFDVISEKNLKSLTQQDDLSFVTSIELEVDTREDSLSLLGRRLPALVELRLVNSIIVSLRDLGGNLHALTILSIPRCGLSDLDGVTALPLLRELYASFNFVSSCRPLALADNLAVLDLEGNNISDAAEADSLSLCRSLETLSLEGNPVLEDPATKEALVATLQQALPNLTRLDIAALPTVASEQAVIRQALQRGDRLDDARPTTAWSRPTTARPNSARPTTGRPGTARPLTGRPMTSRPGTSRRPGTTLGRPGTARIGSETLEDELEDASSDLTQGDTVFCGNPLKALMARRQPSAEAAATAEMSQEDLEALLRSVGLDDTRATDDSPVDLDAWRAQYRRTTQLLESDGVSASPLVSSSPTPTLPLQPRAPSGPAAIARPSPPPASPPVEESEGDTQRRRTLPRPPTAGRALPQPPSGARPRTGSGVRRLPGEPTRPSSGPASGPTALSTAATS